MVIALLIVIPSMFSYLWITKGQRPFSEVELSEQDDAQKTSRHKVGSSCHEFAKAKNIDMILTIEIFHGKKIILPPTHTRTHTFLGISSEYNRSGEGHVTTV